MMRSRVFKPVVCKYESNHVITGVGVEHGQKPLDYRSLMKSISGESGCGKVETPERRNPKVKSP
jgi:hypothetical protein